MNRQKVIKVTVTYNDIGIIVDTKAEVEHEPKTGHWIYHPEWEEDGGCPYECDQCGRTYDYKMNFCGYCGAKMEV